MRISSRTERRSVEEIRSRMTPCLYLYDYYLVFRTEDCSKVLRLRRCIFACILVQHFLVEEICTEMLVNILLNCGTLLRASIGLVSVFCLALHYVFRLRVCCEYAICQWSRFTQDSFCGAASRETANVNRRVSLSRDPPGHDVFFPKNVSTKTPLVLYSISCFRYLMFLGVI